MTVPLFLPHTGAHCAPRSPYRAPLWRRVRRMLLTLLPARTVTVSLADEEPYPAAAPVTLTDAEIAALLWPSAPRHASGERINCGGHRRGTLPRRDPGATLIEGVIDRGPDRPPWLTGELAAIANAATLAMYRGDWNVKPGADVLEGERLAKGLIA